jgi:hypothetical protein
VVKNEKRKMKNEEWEAVYLEMIYFDFGYEPRANSQGRRAKAEVKRAK